MIQLFDTFVNIYSYNDLNEKILGSISKDKKNLTFFCLNSYSLYLINKNPNYKKLFNQSDYIIPDGISIPIAAKILYNKNISKIRVNLNFFLYLLDIIIKQNLKVFLLGSHKKTINKAKDILIGQGVNIIDINDGYNITQETITKINQAKPDILVVGMGMPKQEIWIMENKDKINSKVIITVGDLIDIIAGESNIAPEWLTNTPFEWVYRLLHDPIRLFPRYIKCQPYYIYLLLKEFIKRSR